jgi:hypothetical protein
MQSRDILAPGYKPRDAVFAARDRCDETVEGIRAVRTAHFKYIRNFYPDRPHLQPNMYKDAKPTLKRLRALHAEGKLEKLPEALLFAERRAHEELYDLAQDPFETRNIASDPSLKETLLQLRSRLDRWMTETKDKGREPEPAAMYDSDMAVYLRERPVNGNSGLAENIRLMKNWAREKPMKVAP